MRNLKIILGLLLVSVVVVGATFNPKDLRVIPNTTGNRPSGTEGQIYSNSTTHTLQYKDNSSWYSLSGPATTDTFTNKSIDADDNTITDIDNGEIKAAAGIALNKLAAATVSRALVSDASGFIVGSTTTAAEILHVNGVTSALCGINQSCTLTGKTLTSPVLNTGVSGTAVLDEDNMASDSATQLATQQSIKAYADTKVAKSTLTAKGSIYAASAASTPAELAVGTNNYVLTADSGEATGLKWALVSGAAGVQTQSYELSNLTLTATTLASALTIDLKTQDGGDPDSDEIVNFGFRSETLTTGTYTIIPVTSARTVTISSGSTLGHSSGGTHWIYIYAMRVSGNVELAVSSSIFDEGTVHSSTAEGGAGAADSNRLLYSTTARTDVSVRLIGRLKSTQATAGTWNTQISEISLLPFKLPTIAAIYTTNTAQEFATGVDEVVVFEDKVHDPYNTVVTNGTSTWEFTAPASRFYSVKWQASMASTSTWDLTDRLHVRLRKGGVDTCVATWYAPANINNNARVNSSCDVYLAAGDTLDFEMEQVSGGTLALDGSAFNRISIIEVGF